MSPIFSLCSVSLPCLGWLKKRQEHVPARGQWLPAPCLTMGCGRGHNLISNTAKSCPPLNVCVPQGHPVGDTVFILAAPQALSDLLGTYSEIGDTSHHHSVGQPRMRIELPSPPGGFFQPVLLGCSSAGWKGCLDAEFAADGKEHAWLQAVSEAVGCRWAHSRWASLTHGSRRP